MVDKKEVIEFFSNDNALINYHNDASYVVINPLIYSEDTNKHPDMKLLPVWTKFSRNLLDSYKECI